MPHRLRLTIKTPFPLVPLLFVVALLASTAAAGGGKHRLAAPSGLAAQAVAADRVALAWYRPEGSGSVSSYLVYRNGGKTADATVAGSELAYVDTGLATATTYSYVVRARDEAGNLSPPSDSVSVTTLAADDAPPSVSITTPAPDATVTAGQLVVTGNASDDVATATQTTSGTTAGTASEPTTYAGAYCSDEFRVSAAGGTALELPICTSRPLASPDSSVTRALLVIHGDSRNAPDYYRYAVDAARADGHLADTLVVAPQFMTSDDVSAYPVSANTLYWSDGGWKIGNDSLTQPLPRAGSVSSFTAIDQLIATLSTRSLFPNLRSVVVVGHSAGGQFTNRYAAGTTIPQQLGENGNRYHFVVANPSSYLYLSPERPVAGSTTSFSTLTSSQLASCSGYNNYKYGINRLNAYMNVLGSAAIEAQYRSRDVVYLLGQLDTDTSDPSLDTSCSGEWQGTQRLERGLAYYSYLGLHFGSSVYNTHHEAIVPDVAHSASAMIKSTQAKPFLFGD